MRTPLTCVMLLVICAAEAWTQTSRDSSRARAIDALDLGTQLRLAVAGHEYFGVLAGRNALDLTLDRHRTRFTVPRSEIQALWVPEGRATVDGFVFGAILGGIAGGGLGYVYGGFMCESGCRAQMMSGTILGAVAGGLAVGFVGALVGTAIPTWERRFP